MRQLFSRTAKDEFRFHPADENAVDIDGARLWQANGIIVISGERTLLRVGPADSGRYHSHLHYDIAKGLFGSGPATPDTVLLGKWEIHLTSNPGPIASDSPPLVRFSADLQ